MFLTTAAELLDDMERALAGLRDAHSKSRAAQGNAVWRDAVIESSAVLTRGICGLLEMLNAPSDLSERDVRARRFAAVRVAEMCLYQATQVQAGFASRNLYAALRPQIEDARAAFRERYLQPPAGIPDYLHMEIVRALAQNDETLLGPQYPGALA